MFPAHPALDSAIVIFCFLIFVFMPFMGILSYYQLKRGKPPRPKRQRYLATIIYMLALFLWTFVAAERIGLVLFPAQAPNPLAWIFAAFFPSVLLLRIWQGWVKITPERKQRMRLLLPEVPAHLPYWILISFLAGLVEEAAYRGVAFALVFGWTDSLPLTVLICAAAFGVAHATQGGKAVLGVTLFGMVFHAIVLLSGSLYVAMVMHAAYDLILGILVMKKFQQEPVAEPAPAMN